MDLANLDPTFDYGIIFLLVSMVYAAAGYARLPTLVDRLSDCLKILMLLSRQSCARKLFSPIRRRIAFKVFLFYF